MKKKRLSKRKERYLFTLIFALFLSLLAYVGDRAKTVNLPDETHPIQFYSSQDGEDLSLCFLSAIERAQKSLLLMIYSLSDEEIMRALKKKSEEGVKVTVLYDPKASRKLKMLGDKVEKRQRQIKALMHLKILVVDGEETWIGSSNMTRASLKFYDNLVSAIHNKSLADLVIKKAEGMKGSDTLWTVPKEHFITPTQDFEMWFLPDNPHAERKLIQLIQSAKKTIKVAMYTFTRKDLTEALIEAHKRGLDVEVALDQNNAKGCGIRVKEELEEASVPLILSQGSRLLHHKFMLIDDEILVNGSANWTKSAFQKNDDCFIIFYHLTPDQSAKINRVWRHLSITGKKTGG